MRTRIKFCGFTREQDISSAIEQGVDALGFVLYERSPRYVSPEHLTQLCAHIPAFINTVGLFVNASETSIRSVLAQAPIQSIQLHGDESFEFAQYLQNTLQRPVIKAVRVNAQTDWDEITRHIHALAGILLDSDSAGYGGSGHGFDWHSIPEHLRGQIILSGGLTVHSVKQAIDIIKPYAVDVSSGIEQGKGIKDPEKMHAFIHAVTHTVTQ